MFLGITIDDKLNWKEHVNYISKKKSKSNGIINRLKTLLPKSALLTLYNTLVLPHLNYSLLLWGHTYKTNLDNLYILQKRVIRNICNANYISNTALLFNELKILTIFDLYNYQLGIFLYKFNEAFNNFYSNYSRYHTFNTRSQHSLSHPYSRTVHNHSQIISTGVYF